ncbi:MAG: CCA tRNA nucleotidyltransferase [Alphaproteobacteria bacterium]|nr:CCA tRNA nucleotidyltransferase [Alphaproteobacteria bacterium]
MIRDNYLDIKKIADNPEIFKIFDIVRNCGGVIRFVGGAVRDAIAGRKSFDIDLSTDLSPEELLEACEDAGVKTVPIGLKFGTLGVLINGNVLEITSLRKDVSTDGRHAVVEFTDDWKEDASRRDLTINAVYADEKGNVFDYYDGISDLEKGLVRFIGDADQRIKEDYLRILRFFRFHSLFAKTKYDKKALKACVDNREGLEKISIERIRDELIKIILTPNAPKVFATMFENDILHNWLGKSEYLSNLQFLINMEEAYGLEPCYLRRFFVLYFPDKELAENIAVRLHMTKKQKEKMMKLADNSIGVENISEEKLRRKIIYQYGKEICFDKLLIESARKQVVPENMGQVLKAIENAKEDVFPVSGRDVIKLRQVEGAQVGAILDKLEKMWLDSDFSLSKEELLKQI